MCIKYLDRKIYHF